MNHRQTSFKVDVEQWAVRYVMLAFVRLESIGQSIFLNGEKVNSGNLWNINVDIDVYTYN